MEESVMTCGNFGRNKKKISKKNLILQHHQKKRLENENNGVEMTPVENLYSNRDDYHITPEQGAVDSLPVENMYRDDYYMMPEQAEDDSAPVDNIYSKFNKIKKSF